MAAAVPTSPRATATRGRLQDHALRLFEERGFDRTTVTEIAGAAGVSHMTFFRYFPTKEDVVLDDPYDPVLAQAVGAQPLDLPVLERVRRGLVSSLEGVGSAEFDRVSRQRLRLVAGVPSLRARLWENVQRTQDAVVAVLVDQGVDRITAAAAVGACLGATTSALLLWGGADEAHDAPGLADHLTSALEVLTVSS